MSKHLLSEKAKGKQRALEPGPSAPAAPPPPPPSLRVLVVRFTEGVQDLSLRLAAKDSVRDIKLKIRTARPELHRRRLRLIHSGRLLTDGTELYAFLAALEDRQRRAATANADARLAGDTDGDPAEATSTSPAPGPATAYLHCSVGPQYAEGEGEGEDHEQTGQIKPLRGFDRLAGAGFSESDIANFRRQFHSRASAEYLSTEEFATDEECEWVSAVCERDPRRRRPIVLSTWGASPPPPPLPAHLSQT
ncbi:hypothetical protein OF83DRAFT_1138573 [Amylostereum chailletii]|nr:hypothetical protein OF83DRAFT_1138573 [Amylostereum chailletii]